MMIAVPYLTMTGFSIYFYRMYKKYQRMLDTTAETCDSLGPHPTVGARES
ncbi:MAG TPA: hypothetical protein VFF73_08425 [Planctomycetota bacterium]|nr:hypothetical protein [Planctomycetota bacterium]